MCLTVFCFFRAKRSDHNICLYYLLCIVGNRLRDRLAGLRPLAVSKITLVVAMDGNGDPIPDSPRGIPLLGDRDGENFIPAGMKTGKIYPPSGLAGC